MQTLHAVKKVESAQEDGRTVFETAGHMQRAQSLIVWVIAEGGGAALVQRTFRSGCVQQ